jgi:tRNA U34 2-thiouridine synthase MnmA/TrmU
MEEHPNPINITPETKANELIEWFMQDARTEEDKARGCIYAGKVAYEIGRSHYWNSFEANFYATVESKCKEKFINI